MQIIKLERPTEAAPLNRILSKRVSSRTFTSQSLEPDQISDLLWSCQGKVRSSWRTSPSAGALYPLEIYFVDHANVSHFVPETHELELHAKGDVRSEIARAALSQEFIKQAPVTIIIAAVYERVTNKYGIARGTRYVHMEAGHAAQNLLLQAAALNLGSVPVGAFEDDEIARILRLPSDHAPLYLLPVGHVGS